MISTLTRWSAAIVVLAVAVGVVITSLAEIIANYSAMPFADQWESVRDWASIQNHGLTLSHLFSQHNEHRIVLARLIFHADFLLAEGRDWINLGTILTVQALHGWLLWSLFRRSRDYPAWLLAMIAGFAAMMGFSALQMENLGWGFQTQFVGVFALGSVSCVALARHADPAASHKPVWLIAALIMGGATTLGMSNGVLIWPVLLVMSIILRLSRGSILTVLIAGLAVAGSYIVNLDSPGNHASIGDSLLRFHEVIAFAAIYVGSPVGFGSIAAASILGGVAVAVALAAFFVALIRGVDRMDATRMTLLCIALFVLASALATGLGRLNFGLGAAAVGRYMTPALVFWMALSGFLLATVWGSAHRWAPIARGALIGLAVIAVASITVGQKRELGRRDHIKTNRDMATTAMWLDIDDKAVLNPLYPPDWKVPFDRRKILRALQLGPFADDWDERVGQPLERAFNVVTADRCTGHFDDITRIGESGIGARVSGWAWDNWRHVPVEAVAVTDGAGIIRGLAITPEKRRDVAKSHKRPDMRDSGWRGHLRIDYEGPYVAHAILKGQRHACPLSGQPTIRD